MRLLNGAITILLFSFLFACASGSVVITGQVRPAIDPSEVMLYLDPPSQYDTIGLIEASSDVEFSSQAAQDRVIDQLKNNAAKIGANGVLLLNIGTGDGGTSGFYYGGMFYATTSKIKIAQAKAIYVIKK
jgi:hypothetical protein